MIIFAGWGILAVAPPALGYVLLSAIGGGSVALGALGLILGGIADWFLGIYFNKTRPARDLAARMDARAAQLHAMADAGTFYRGPGYPMPTSLADAHQQADALAAEEYHAVKGRVANRHTLFFIPMQFIGPIVAAVGVMMGITALVQGR